MAVTNSQKKEQILRLVRAGVSRNEIAKRLKTSLSTISCTARAAGIFRYDSSGMIRITEYLKKYPHKTLKEVATSLNLSSATVSIAASNLGLKRRPVRRHPTDMEWACLRMWIDQKKYEEIGATLDISRQRAYEAVALCCGKLGLQRHVMQYVTPIGG